MAIRTLTFTEWRAHWGEARLAALMADKMRNGADQWTHRAVYLNGYPTWELVPGFQWTENWAAIRRLWKCVGGRLFEDTRLIAAKWDDIWSRFALGFPNGNLKPHPPYSPESCAHWRQVDADEAIVLGVITEAELELNMPRNEGADVGLQRAFDRLSPEGIEQLKRDLDDLLGPGGRAERHARKKEQEKARAAESARIYAERNRERDAVDQMFRRMNRMDEIFTTKHADRRDSPGVLMTELQELMRTPVFDRYPHWRARAIRYAAVLLEEEGRLAEALEYYLSAIEWCPGMPLKRKIAALRKQTKK